MAVKDQAEEIALAYRMTFASAEGQTVLKDLIQAHYILNPLPLDQIHYAEGQRNVILRIMALSGVKPLK